MPSTSSEFDSSFSSSDSSESSLFSSSESDSSISESSDSSESFSSESSLSHSSSSSSYSDSSSLSESESYSSIDDWEPEPGECDCNTPPEQPCPPDSNSEKPVAYGSGLLVHRETDLFSDAFGIAWGHSRSYANVLRGGAEPTINGNRWLVSQLRDLSFEGGGGGQPTRVIVRDGALSSTYFILSGGVYVNEFVGWNSLVWDSTNHVYVLTITASGEQWVFADHTGAWSAGQRGKAQQVIDPAGRAVTCSYDGSDQLEKFEQVVGGQTSGYYYTYGGPIGTQLESVTLKVDGQFVRRVVFSYYDGSTTDGNLGDLQQARIEQYAPGTAEGGAADAWEVIERKHYRYYLPAEAGGFTSGLKLVLGAAAYANMLAAGLNPETATMEEAREFADFYYEYDAQMRVTREELEGGRRAYTYSYETHPSHDGAPNTWLTRTIETRPDGSEHRVYTNAGHAVLVKILQQGADQWVDAYVYTSQYRLAQHAHPSAVESVTEPSGGSSTLTVVLRAAAGRIEVWDYYTETHVGDGKVDGYVDTVGVKQGSGGTVQVTRKLKYDTHTVGGISIHPLREVIVFPVAGASPSTAPTTSYARTWRLDAGSNETFQVLQLDTTDPEVSGAENGSDVAGETSEVYDAYGRVTWQKNQRGVITYTSYDPATGAFLQRIEDVNTSLMSDVPAGWSASGVHLITDFVSDLLGRVTQARGPWHEVQLRECDTAPTTIRRVAFTAYNDAAHEERNASGYLTGTQPEPEFAVAGAVRVTRRDGDGRTLDEIQAVRCCTCGPLTAGEALPQEKWSRWTQHVLDPWGRRVATLVYFRIPKSGPHSPVCGTESSNNATCTPDALTTLYGYDDMGRRNRVVDPAGTIERTVFDTRGLPLSRWIGTDDTGATDADPTGGGAAGNNMKLVAALEYDGGAAGGDGNLTEETRPVDDTSGNDRITTYGYDFRDRRDTETQTDGTTTWITKTTYDNLDQITGSTRYHTSVTNANRLAQSRAFFDALGRVYKTETDGIDPATGNVAGTLTGQNWYDLASNLIKQSAPGATVFTKTHYDALNRAIASYLACVPGTAGVPSGDDNSVLTDTVIEQGATTYDRGGNVILTTLAKRFDDATGAGELLGPQTQPKSRDSYQAFWPDAIGRVRASADYGTNGGTAPSRPSVAPQRSDTILVTTRRYKDSGDENAIIDAMGLETRWENDQAGRRIKLIEGIVNGAAALLPPNGSPYVVLATACTPPVGPPPAAPRITEFCWHPSGQLATLTLVNADTGNQVTRWVYGTTLADSALASNGLLRAKIYPESSARPAPAASGDEAYARLAYKYNRQGQATEFKDADDTTHEYSFNKMGWLTDDRATTLGEGVNGDVRRIARAYDVRGLLHKVTSHSAVSGGSVVNEVELAYDAFGNLSSDKQSHSGAVSGSTPKVTYTYESGGVKNTTRRTTMTYPNGRVLETAYGTSNGIDDHLSRVKSLKVTGEASDLVSYLYMGAALQVKISYAQPAVDCLYRKISGEPDGDAGDPYTGYDRFGRTVDIRWRKSSTDLARMQYGFDRDSRRTWRRQVGASGQDQQYQYDALSQVTGAARGNLNLNQTAIAGTPTSTQSWDYDPTGNWRGFSSAESGLEPLAQTRVHDRGNRLTQIEDNVTPVLLDRVGRVLQSAPDNTGDWSGKLHLIWDAWSRVVQSGVNGYDDRGIYQYDGLHRRITRNVDGHLRHHYYSDLWRPVEERIGTQTTAVTQYAWGARHRDDLVRYETTIPGVGAATRYVLMDYFSPAALTDTSGAVQERYAFSAFGIRRLMAANYSPRTDSECAFQGQFLDAESGLYNYGYRYYSPYLGRWMCKDPIEEEGGVNLYGFADNSGVNWVDHLGLQACECKNGAKMEKDDYGEWCCPHKIITDNKGKRNCIAAKVNKTGSSNDIEDDDDGGVGGRRKDCDKEKAALEKAFEEMRPTSDYVARAQQAYFTAGRNRNTAKATKYFVKGSTFAAEQQHEILELGTDRMNDIMDDLVDKSNKDIESTRQTYMHALSVNETAVKKTEAANKAYRNCLRDLFGDVLG